MVGHLASPKPLHMEGWGGKWALMGCTRRTTGPTGTLPLPTADQTHTHTHTSSHKHTVLGVFVACLTAILRRDNGCYKRKFDGVGHCSRSHLAYSTLSVAGRPPAGYSILYELNPSCFVQAGCCLLNLIQGIRRLINLHPCLGRPPPV